MRSTLPAFFGNLELEQPELSLLASQAHDIVPENDINVNMYVKVAPLFQKYTFKKVGYPKMIFVN